ncbi:MAG TPA: hypothetical protein VJV05_17450 [Pyrinomonadaceae bacterium]|nr:hypothetical protein [Pyrinomonadaceae bacterium]
MSDRRVLGRFFFVTLALTVLCWSAVLFFPAAVREGFETVFAVSNKLSIAFLGLVFGMGMFLAYTAFRIRYPDIEDQSLDSELMGTLSFQSRSARRFRVWVVSTAVGSVNLLFLVGLDLWLTS